MSIFSDCLFAVWLQHWCSALREKKKNNSKHLNTGGGLEREVQKVLWKLTPWIWKKERVHQQCECCSRTKQQQKQKQSYKNGKKTGRRDRKVDGATQRITVYSSKRGGGGGSVFSPRPVAVSSEFPEEIKWWYGYITSDLISEPRFTAKARQNYPSDCWLGEEPHDFIEHQCPNTLLGDI